MKKLEITNLSPETTKMSILRFWYDQEGEEYSYERI